MYTFIMYDITTDKFNTNQVLHVCFFSRCDELCHWCSMVGCKPGKKCWTWIRLHDSVILFVPAIISKLTGSRAKKATTVHH